MNKFRFTKKLRLRTQADFDRVYKDHAYSADDTLVIQGCKNSLGHPRLGLSVSKKVGNAVVRAKWKRLIREAFRLQQAELPQDIDFVVRPRKGATADIDLIKRSLLKQSQRVTKRLEKTG